jgi:hypothetical protein
MRALRGRCTRIGTHVKAAGKQNVVAAAIETPAQTSRPRKPKYSQDDTKYSVVVDGVEVRKRQAQEHRKQERAQRPRRDAGFAECRGKERDRSKIDRRLRVGVQEVVRSEEPLPQRVDEVDARKFVVDQVAGIERAAAE